MGVPVDVPQQLIRAHPLSMRKQSFPPGLQSVLTLKPRRGHQALLEVLGVTNTEAALGLKDVPRQRSPKQQAHVTAHLCVLGWDIRFLHSVVMFAVGGRSDLKDNLPHTFSQRDICQSLCDFHRDPVASAT